MQTLIVVLMVLAAGMYAGWYLMPSAMRRSLAARVSGRSQKLASTIASAPGCGACDSCGSCATPGHPDAVKKANNPTVQILKRM